MHQQQLLIGAVIAVGILHTVVPDHWAPIALLARQRGWSRGQTARTAAVAGVGHTLSTLAIGLVVWFAGEAVAQRFGHLVSLLSSVALMAFGLWIAIASWRELRDHDRAHAHGHEHHQHQGVSETNGRTALLLILGSSPMLEGIPAFFAAAKFGPALIAVMSVCFAISTIATYVVLCISSQSLLQRLKLGLIERYGEVLSGTIIALIGAVFLISPIA